MLHSKSDDDIPVAAAVVAADPPLAVAVDADPPPLANAGLPPKEEEPVDEQPRPPPLPDDDDEDLTNPVHDRPDEQPDDDVAADPPRANTIEYESIPKLLFVDMQAEDDEEKVAAAVTNLADLLTTSNANWKVNADQALSLGAIAIILLLMRKWHYNRSIQFHGCCILARLPLTNDEVAPEQLTNDEGAPVGLLFCYQTVEGWYNGPFTATCEPGPVRYGYQRRRRCSSCTRLKELQESQHRRNTAAAAVSIIKSGGIETIMAAMKSFPDDDDIQGEGCNAIGNAFDYADPTIDKAMACFVHKLKGIELVVLAMMKFQNNASVQNMGCYVLNQLSRKQVLRDALKKGGALSACDLVQTKNWHLNDLLQNAHSFDWT